MLKECLQSLLTCSFGQAKSEFCNMQVNELLGILCKVQIVYKSDISVGIIIMTAGNSITVTAHRNR